MKSAEHCGGHVDIDLNALCVSVRHFFSFFFVLSAAAVSTLKAVVKRGRAREDRLKEGLAQNYNKISINY